MVKYLPGVLCKEFMVSSKNSLCKVVVTCSPGSTMPPGRAHSFESLRCMAQNCKIGLKNKQIYAISMQFLKFYLKM